MAKKLKLKNGREIKVTFKGVEGATQEEIDRVWNNIFDILFDAMRDKEKLDKQETS